MTAPAQQPASGQAGLLERLLAAVRIEFRADILVPARTTRSWAGRPARPAAATGPGRRTAFAPRTGNGGRTAAART